jgi:hypothetical protein
VLITEYYSGIQIKEDIKATAGSLCGREEKCTQVCGGKTRRKQVSLEVGDIDWKVFLKCVFKQQDGRMQSELN